MCDALGRCLVCPLPADDAEDLAAAQQLAALAGAGRQGSTQLQQLPLPEQRDAAGQQEQGQQEVLHVGVLRTLSEAAEAVPACTAAGAFFSDLAAAAEPQPPHGSRQGPAHARTGTAPVTRTAAAGAAAAAAAGAAGQGPGVAIDAATSIVLMQQAADLVRGMHEELQKSREQVGRAAGPGCNFTAAHPAVCAVAG